MPSRRITPIHFPLGGVNRRFAVQNQAQAGGYTTPLALNVWPDAQGRERGGSRPGIGRSFVGPEGLGMNASPITMINGVTFIPGAEGAGDGIATTLVASTATPTGTEPNLFWCDPSLSSTFAAVDGNPIFSPNQLLQSAEHLERLYIADHDDTEQGSTLSFFPKIFDPETDLVTTWSDEVTAGDLPLGCPLICLWRDRILLGGGAITPNDVMGSKQGDPLNWDFSDTLTSGAFALSATSAGAIGDRLTCMSTHADNCVMLGCSDSMWLMMGDPKFGGQVKNLSNRVGVLDRNAFCVSPDGLFLFLSRDGLYACAAGCKSLEAPERVSREKLPQELLNIDVSIEDSGNAVSMVYDLYHGGIYIFVTPRDPGSDGAVHWFYHWGTKSFWPFQFASPSFDPWCVHSRKNFEGSEKVLLGCADGFVRSFDTTKQLDGDQGEDWFGEDAAGFQSYVVFGPFSDSALYSELMLAELAVVLSQASSPVFWEVFTGNTAEEGAAAAEAGTRPAARGQLGAGRSFNSHPRVRGQSLYLKLRCAGGGWAFEGMTAGFAKLGKVRM